MKLAALGILLLFLQSTAAWPMTDPAGDLSVSGLTTAPVDSGGDLLGLDILETKGDVTFQWETSARSSVPVWGKDAINYYLQFSFEGESYFLSSIVSTALGTPGDQQGRFTLYQKGATVFGSDLDLEGNFISATIPKEKIINLDGGKFTAGRTLTDISAESAQSELVTIDGETLDLGRDRMPDSGSEEFLANVGPVIHQDLNLKAIDPTRWSNGGASTYAFQVQVSAKGETSFHAEDVPDGWSVYVPEPVSGETEVSVYVKTPGRHIHDGHEEFLLVAESGDVRSELALGVYYPPIAMPAGHHPQLYLHEIEFENEPTSELLFGVLFNTLGGNFDNAPYMNTEMPEGPFSVEAISIEGDFMGTGEIWGWAVPLVPGLRTGLNLTAGTLVSEFSFEAPALFTSGRLGGELVIWETWTLGSAAYNGTVLASFQTEVLDIGAPVTPEWTAWSSGIISYDQKQKLGLNLYYAPEDAAFQAAIGPIARPSLSGGSIHLPLGEYNDDVTIPLTAEQEEAVETLGDEEPEVKETPFLPVAIVALLVSCLRRLRN